MKAVPISLFLYLMMHGICAEDATYTTKYDGIDLDEILASERLLNGYINCLLDKGPCTPDGKELKTNLPDAISNDCRKCSEKQREGSDRVMHYIIDHRAQEWDELENKYQSDGSYKQKYIDSKHNNQKSDKTDPPQAEE